MFRTININNESTCYSINEYGEVINDKTNKKLKGSINKENILKELRKGQTTKKIIAFKDGVYIGEYYSCAEAARQLGCDSSAISKVCRGIYQHTHGFTFEYKE